MKILLQLALKGLHPVDLMVTCLVLVNPEVTDLLLSLQDGANLVAQLTGLEVI